MQRIIGIVMELKNCESWVAWNLQTHPAVFCNWRQARAWTMSVLMLALTLETLVGLLAVLSSYQDYGHCFKAVCPFWCHMLCMRLIWLNNISNVGFLHKSGGWSEFLSLSIGINCHTSMMTESKNPRCVKLCEISKSMPHAYAKNMLHPGSIQILRS